jgi:hypothetical protein
VKVSVLEVPSNDENVKNAGEEIPKAPLGKAQAELKKFRGAKHNVTMLRKNTKDHWSRSTRMVKTNLRFSSACTFVPDKGNNGAL